MAGNYTPPSCEFNRVIMNFTVTSAGRQFDRLALMYFGDTEVWRTSTAEPRAPPGIIWTYWKDMTEYLYFWKSPQKLIFDLGNLIDDTYTGPFNTTLTATFFKSDVDVDHSPPADLIIPITAKKSASNEISAWHVPDVDAVATADFPRNVRRAVFSVSANGQSEEEFWWSNVMESDAATFNATGGMFPGLSPFREVQVLIDGKLAGVHWPFPVIFTGGISPTFHRPIVGINAYDLREQEIDLTPWLPLLCDGKQHTFKLQVAGIDDVGKAPALTDKVKAYWVLTGKVFIWLDDEGSVTTGQAPTVAIGDPVISLSHAITQDREGYNETLSYRLEVRRTVSVKGEVVSQKGTDAVSWSQNLNFVSLGKITDYGGTSVNDQTTTGTEESTGKVSYRSSYSYPLVVSAAVTANAARDITLYAELMQGLDLEVEGATVFPTGLEAFAAVPRTEAADYLASKLSSRRDGFAYFFQTNNGRRNTGFGSTNHLLRFGGVSKAGMLGDRPDIELYFRNATAVNDTLTYDKEVMAGEETDRLLAAKLMPAVLDSPTEFAPVPADGSATAAFIDRVGGRLRTAV
jgi:hypothetical protein